MDTTDANDTCKSCGRPVTLKARGLCSTCYGKHLTAGTISQFCLTGKTSQKGKKQAGRNLVSHSLTCRLCGKTVKVRTMPGETPDPRRLCHECKQRAADMQPPEGQVLIGVSLRVGPGTTNASPAGACRRIRPGDAEFARIAAQCTPPANIQPRHGLGQHYRP